MTWLLHHRPVVPGEPRCCVPARADIELEHEGRVEHGISQRSVTWRKVVGA